MKSELSYQHSLFDLSSLPPAVGHAKYNSRSGAFVDNMCLPVHRWFRYSAGFSADWVRHLVRQEKDLKGTLRVLDPFAGVGTTLLACDAEQVESVGFETHPFIHRVSRAKLRAIHLNVENLASLMEHFLEDALAAKPRSPDKVAVLLSKCYAHNTLVKLNALKETYLSEYTSPTPESEVLWLVVTSILRSCSCAGTAQWQYVLPNKKKKKILDPFQAFRLKASEVLGDILNAQQAGWAAKSRMLLTDARVPQIPQEMHFDAVITSPPYPNNYDYSDATRLEMTFWGEVSNWGDLHQAVRKYLVCSCSQHSAAERLVLEDLLKEDVLKPIRDDLTVACSRLATARLSRGGRKSYHTMAAAYFVDLGRAFQALRPLCADGSVICFVIGDSAPYGVHLKVDQWLGDLAVAAGFKSYRFEKIRDRNVKWHNRKHRIPLKEGRLWIKG
jgi:hypothetical protein